MKKIIAVVTISLCFFLFDTPPIHAQIDINLGVPSGQPIFTVENMLPGDMEQRLITVTNTSNSPTQIQVKCIEIEELKNFSTILDIVIKQDGTDIYGGNTGLKTVEQFCQDASSELSLGVVNPNQVDIYTFKVTFPFSAGNEYQLAKYVFDLIFQTESVPNLVINEVYYLVEKSHGLDCRKDRNLIISGNGAGSTNIIDYRYNNSCVVVQNNQANISNNVSTSSNTGGNSNSGNTSSSSTIITGNSSSNVSINVTSNYNVSLGACTNSGTKHSDEWVEIYNPTNQRISLKYWALMDNSGQLTKINSNTRIKPGGYALISKTKATWKYWNEPRTPKVKLGQEIGDGLDNTGDHLFLINPDGQPVDFTAWGDDTKIWNPAVPLVPLGSSMERLTSGLDTNQPEDWHQTSPPSPGE